MTLALTPAAVCQCFTLVSLCTSIADPNWIQLQNCSDPDGRLIYGVAFIMHAYQNNTDTGPLGGLRGWGMGLLYSLAALCYTAVLLSSAAFLLDFLGAAATRSQLVTSLHVSSAAGGAAVLSVCAACMCVIRHNLGERGPSLCLLPGESFYIQTLGLSFSVLACVFSLRCRPDPVGSCDFLSVGGAGGETEPLIGGAEGEE